MAAILVLAGIFWIGGIVFRGQSGQGHLVITVDNEVYGTYNLGEDREIEIDSTNRCGIAQGRAIMIWADCPDQVCVRSRAIETAGETIICMPNRVVLEVAVDE